MEKNAQKFMKAFKSLVVYCAKADDDMKKCMHEANAGHPDWTQEHRVAYCLSVTGQSNKK